MKRLGLMALVLCSLIACGKAPVEDEESKSSKNPTLSDKVITVRDCGTDVPAGMSIYKSEWMVQRRTAKNVIVTESYRFEPNAVTQTVTCAYNTQSVTAVARANAGVSNTDREFVITSNAQETKTLNVGGTYNCTARLDSRIESFRFKFDGSCLALAWTSDYEETYISAN